MVSLVYCWYGAYQNEFSKRHLWRMSAHIALKQVALMQVALMQVALTQVALIQVA